MTPEQIDSLLDILQWFAGGGLLALTGYLVARYKAKTERASAVSHGGAELVDASTGFVETLIARIENLEGRVTAAELRIGTQDGIIASQSSEISLLHLVVTIWSNAWMDLEARWPYHRTQDAPPPRPVTPCVEPRRPTQENE